MLSKDSIENILLKKININSESFLSEDALSEKLQLQGFFYNSIDSVIENQKKDTIYYYVTLRKRIDSIQLKVPYRYNQLKTEIPYINNGIIKTSLSNLENILEEFKKHLTKKGKAFSSIKLSEIQLTENKVIANLRIQESKERIVNQIIVKGYKDFPKSYLQHYLKIKTGNLFNKEQINEATESINNLNFAKTTKTPEALFKKDSTILYLYIEKVNENSIDGLLNFSTNPVSKNLSITGNLNLELVNILNTGEELKFSWNANGNESQNINLSAKIPFLFSSPISNLSLFEIHKQDSTFLNSKFRTNFSYNLNSKSEIGINYQTETSTNNLQTNITTIEDFSSSFIGLNYNYKKPKQHNLFKTKFLFNIGYQTGRRTIENNNTNQHRVNFETYYLFDINSKNSIFIKNQSNFLFSKNYLTNELFRIGGPNSIRGLNPQSIFTSKYSFFNLEYRIQTNLESYLYSITDFGVIEGIDNQKQKLISLGAGYSFKIKQSKIDLIFSGNLNNTTSNNKGFNVSISFKNYF
ncbi:surface antigen-like variable number repeat protein [Tenacibaculum skagerrakense]|uniref:Surface antigen-like variable number repeat protein n=1 Tax=Tenacibaculum skagerrakense TaxID=186571 RepID=A0A4R2NXC6_9FLAO|nr:POTRA domain-containing protein [Tenacibaculum skagerrakense]TCP26692.1 surface antigen-like variable number repeat protein [Tenacibaculum skagerrakense]